MDSLRVIAEQLLPVFTMLLVAALTPVGVWLGQQLAKKLKVEWQSSWNTVVGRIVVQAVHYVEEWARQALRAGNQVTGAQKLEMAMRYVNEQLAAARLPAMAARHLQQLIESALHIERPEMEAVDAYFSSDPGTAPPTPVTRGGGGGGLRAATAGLVLLLVSGLAGVSCAPLTRPQADAAQTTTSVGCVLVDTWCNPLVIVSAPERFCRLASDVCHSGEAALAVLLPGLTEAPAEAPEGTGVARRTAALTATQETEPRELAMAYSEWGLWCSHVEDEAAAGLCEAVRRGSIDQVSIAITVVPEAAGVGR